MASSRLASVIGSVTMRAFSRRTGTVIVTFSVSTHLRSRAVPVWRVRRVDVELLLGAGHRVVGLGPLVS